MNGEINQKLEMFHTALRKGCSTEWSVIWWNYLHQLAALDDDYMKKDRVLSHFNKWVSRFLNEDPSMKLSDAIKKWGEMYNNYTIDLDDRPPSRNMGTIVLAYMIKLTDAETWNDIDNTVECWLQDNY